MVSLLANEKWNEIYNEFSNVNRRYIVFEQIIKSAIDKFTTCMLANAKNKRLKEWMTNGLLTSARCKQHLSMKYVKNILSI